VYILIVLAVLGGLGYGAARFARQRRTAGQSHPQAAQSPPTMPGQRLSEPVPRPAGGWAVEVHGLSKWFGALAAVDDVDLLVPRGSAFGYLGPNGAGKTTLIRVLLGLTRADSGTMSLLGLPVPGQRDRRRTQVPRSSVRTGEPEDTGRGQRRRRREADRPGAGPDGTDAARR
jgi:ABC-type glutathione transport system ATPase component